MKSQKPVLLTSLVLVGTLFQGLLELIALQRQPKPRKSP